MKKTLLLVTVLASAFATSNAQANKPLHIENIAGAYVCKNASGAIQKVIGQDTWEADQSSLYSIVYNDTVPAEAQLDQMIRRILAIHPSLSEDLRIYRDRLRPATKFVSGSVAIAQPSAASNIQMSGCELQGLMSYDNESQVLVINQDLLNGLSHETEKAAAYLHVLLSLALQKDKAQPDIANVKLINGCFFSNDPLKCLGLEPFVRPLKFDKAERVWHCTSQDQQAAFYFQISPFGVAYEDWTFIVDKVKGTDILAANAGRMHWLGGVKGARNWSIEIGSGSYANYDALSETDVPIKVPGRLREVPFTSFLARLSLLKFPQALVFGEARKFSCESIVGTSLPFVPMIPKLKPRVYEQYGSDSGYLACDAQYLGYDSSTKLVGIKWVQADLSSIIRTTPCDRIGKKYYFRQMSSYLKGEKTIWKGFDPATGKETDHYMNFFDKVPKATGDDAFEIDNDRYWQP